ncbi:aromatic amino acid hydroxylase [Mucilaginibacter sp. UR6-11]|uniref:aromatic amino acid hydroxylase n=1 Tax=Mucilaginibacter sp. UR6-11 TaxID=1435644 RepID=UPI001E37A2C1|nr:aromatic amino acid hydroxylase [Mucilaginibacter sp. UR6-11]MCC8426328.1 aromatic amino acid hydroxylase [Mucilaginibacter sp. UR6-11]
MNDFGNKQVAALPRHLRQYIVEQHYDHYTPVDQAAWRYVMRQNYAYLKDVAYYPYIPGLKAAGLTIEQIPHLQEMNDALGKIGWGAVTVDGFIPPAAFMEYQAYRVLVIAADIRQLNHIEYTPAPDIIHESAGHAPIIADPDYHQYLSYFGSIGAKAMYSAQDYELYEAIRALSILKEMPEADPAELKKAEEQVAYWQQNIGEPSEMALLSRLHWWTVEYGLIGTLENPKIYGAGLLSSIGESATCMQPNIRKLWYTPDAVNYAYDITQPQKQLFVTPTFQNLIDVLEQFANKMAFRIGGTYGLQKALESNNTCTVVYSSGLQVSGTLTDFNAGFIKMTGPTALAVDNKQQPGHGKEYHKEGFSSPVGKFTADTSIEIGNTVKLNFESGITVKGTIRSILPQLITFENCMVKSADGDILFDPAWGAYDMAVGESIISVFSGAADKNTFDEIGYHPKTTTYHLTYSKKMLALHQLYREVRDCRVHQAGKGRLKYIFEQLCNEFPEDWLCALEILELAESDLAITITQYLKKQAIENPELNKLITDGLSLIGNQHSLAGGQ